MMAEQAPVSPAVFSKRLARGVFTRKLLERAPAAT